MWDNKLVYKALFFATDKHRDLFMKNPLNMPYSAHPTAVMINSIKYATLMNCEIDWNLLLCSALLHDTIEDTDATYEEIKQEFGQSIADGVEALSKNPELREDLQMVDSLERIKKQPKEIAIVKLSDRLFNIRNTVPHWTKEKSAKYKEESKLILKELGDYCLPLKEDLAIYIKNYR